VPIVVRREIDGFILNRQQGVLLSEAVPARGRGICDAADLDKTLKDGLGLR
jgi:L-gulonate 3-dehydrogenase